MKIWSSQSLALETFKLKFIKYDINMPLTCIVRSLHRIPLSPTDDANANLLFMKIESARGMIEIKDKVRNINV